MTTKFQIPPLSEAPSEEMIEWLHKCTQDWDGDESGVNIDGVAGGPGDWIFETDGLYAIVLASSL